MNSANSASAEYRRGTVFGLTVAEIFILLLFLLLLLFSLFHQEITKDAREQKERRIAAEKSLEELEPYREVIQEFEKPDEIRTLRRAHNQARKEAEQSRRKAELLEDLVSESEEEQEAVKENLAALQEAEDKLAEANKELESTQEKYEEALDSLRVTKKGQNPPCWYQKVSTSDGGTREKPHYSLKVAVFQDHFILRADDIPPGGAIDDNGGLYADEALRLNIPTLPYEQPIKFQQLESVVKHLYDAGKNSEVRTYSCIFWVRVWDEIPIHANAKEIWQYAHDDILEGLFGTFRIRDQAWDAE